MSISRNQRHISISLTRSDWLRVQLVLAAYSNLGGEHNQLNTIHARIGDQIRIWDKKYDEEKYHA